MDRSESLERLIPPPSHPLEVPTREDWLRCEQELGPLPPDYIDFVTQRGTGITFDFLWIFNPGSANAYLELTSAVCLHCYALRVRRDKHDCAGDAVPVFPEPEGYLPFGITDRGAVLFWARRGPPTDWHVIIATPQWDGCFGFDGSMSALLRSLASGQMPSRAFPEFLPGEEVDAFRSALAR